MSATPLELQRLAPSEGPRLREVRLRALLDAPDAFARTHADEAARPAAFWTQRLTDPAVANFVARDPDAGHDLGLVACLPWTGRPDTLGLFGMWVDPSARGRGVGDLLVRAVLERARAEGFPRVRLEVADDNVHAIALYARHGFVATGEGGALPPPREHITEHVRERVVEPPW